MEDFKNFLGVCMDQAADTVPHIRVVPRISKITGEIEFYAHSQSGSSITFDSETADEDDDMTEAEADAMRMKAAIAEVARAEAADAKAEADERWANEGGAE